MKFFLVILIFIVAVAIADQDDDLWKSYKVSRTISDMDYIDEDNIWLLCKLLYWMRNHFVAGVEEIR